MSEVWLPAVGYETLYEVSDFGRVRAINRSARGPAGRVLNPYVGRDGYPRVSLGIGKVRRTLSLHVVVLTAFRGRRPEGLCGRHLDGDPSNNRLDNLVWGTYAANAADTLRHGRRVSRVGEQTAKLSAAQARLIRRRCQAGESHVSVAVDFPVGRTAVGRITRGETWRDVR